MKLETSGDLELKANGVTIDAGGGAFSAKGVAGQGRGQRHAPSSRAAAQTTVAARS